MSLIRSMRGGKDYDANWNQRMRGTGPYAWQISRRIEMTCKRLEMNTTRLQLRSDLFADPNPPAKQLSLL